MFAGSVDGKTPPRREDLRAGGVSVAQRGICEAAPDKSRRKLHGDEVQPELEEVGVSVIG